MSKELDEIVDHETVGSALENVGLHEASSAIRDGIAAKIPWRLLFEKFATLALPLFLEWVKEWIKAKNASQS